MEQNLNDKPLSNMQITRYIESLKKEMNFDDEVYGLVKSDLEDGLTQEQTEKYLDKNFNIGQMKVLSEGLHTMRGACPLSTLPVMGYLSFRKSISAVDVLLQADKAYCSLTKKAAFGAQHNRQTGTFRLYRASRRVRHDSFSP